MFNLKGLRMLSNRVFRLENRKALNLRRKRIGPTPMTKSLKRA